MRDPNFSRQTAADDTADDRTVATGGTTTARDDAPQPVRPRRDDPDQTAAIPATRSGTPEDPSTARTEAQRAATHAERAAVAAETATPTRPAPSAPTRRPRASLLATLSLILAVAGAMLVLSGPLVGYGVGVAGLALVLSIAGLRATGKWHVAGKTDALIAMVLALGAIVLGVLALTGSLSWLGTDAQPATNFREWLDAQFENRF